MAPCVRQRACTFLSAKSHESLNGTQGGSEVEPHCLIPPLLPNQEGTRVLISLRGPASTAALLTAERWPGPPLGTHGDSSVAPK